jgi:hypothetical protein
MTVTMKNASSGMLCHVTLVRTDVPPKRGFLQELHGVTSQRRLSSFPVSVPEMPADFTFSIVQLSKCISLGFRNHCRLACFVI